MSVKDMISVITAHRRILRICDHQLVFKDASLSCCRGDRGTGPYGRPYLLTVRYPTGISWRANSRLDLKIQKSKQRKFWLYHLPFENEVSWQILSLVPHHLRPRAVLYHDRYAKSSTDSHDFIPQLRSFSWKRSLLTWVLSNRSSESYNSQLVLGLKHSQECGRSCLIRGSATLVARSQPSSSLDVIIGSADCLYRRLIRFVLNNTQIPPLGPPAQRRNGRHNLTNISNHLIFARLDTFKISYLVWSLIFRIYIVYVRLRSNCHIIEGAGSKSMRASLLRASAWQESRVLFLAPIQHDIGTVELQPPPMNFGCVHGRSHSE
jgi:hypothetical protein